MRMLRLLPVLLAFVALAGFTLAADEAKDITVTGKIVCAKCSLHKDDAKECQNVIVATVDGKTTEYYLAKNKVSEDFGHVCKGEKEVIATGKVKEKDGKTWLDATKLEQPQS